MRDYLNIGSSPVDEPCAQLGSPNYEQNARIECKAFLHQLIRTFGQPPYGARLAIKSFDHDFGCYYEVVCYFYDNCQDAIDYAFKLEGETPQRWDERALAEIEEAIDREVMGLAP